MRQPHAITIEYWNGTATTVYYPRTAAAVTGINTKIIQRLLRNGKRHPETGIRFTRSTIRRWIRCRRIGTGERTDCVSVPAAAAVTGRNIEMIRCCLKGKAIASGDWIFTYVWYS